MTKMFAFTFRHLVVIAALPFALIQAGCPGPQYPNCKTDDQCKVGNGAEAKSGVCVFGKCQECAKESDCPAGKQCHDYMCMQACAGDESCGSAMHCENGFCKNDCVDATACADGEICNAGRCMAQVTCTEQSDCQSGFLCVSGLCTRTDTAQGSLMQDCLKEGRVFFDFNMFDLKPDGVEALEQMAGCMRAHPDWKLLVTGHTDNRGATEYNLTLGERRASAVSDHLSRLGIDKSRIKKISYGEEKPMDESDNEEAWAKNRRSEISVQ